jgi:thiamine transporter
MRAGFLFPGGGMERKAMWQKFLEGFTNPFADPKTLTVLIILVGLLLLTLLFFALRKLKLGVRTLVVASLTIAIAYILSYMKFYRMPFGGSITPASMLPILLFAWYYGTLPGMAVGLVFGLLQMTTDLYVVHPVQLFMDYMLAYAALGLAGLFKKNLSVGIIVAGLTRAVVHILSGVVFFASDAPQGQSPWIYSILYNMTYLGPDIIICLLVANIPQFKSAVQRAFQGRPVTA